MLLHHRAGVNNRVAVCKCLRRAHVIGRYCVERRGEYGGTSLVLISVDGGRISYPGISGLRWWCVLRTLDSVACSASELDRQGWGRSSFQLPAFYSFGSFAFPPCQESQMFLWSSAGVQRPDSWCPGSATTSSLVLVVGVKSKIRWSTE